MFGKATHGVDNHPHDWKDSESGFVALNSLDAPEDSPPGDNDLARGDVAKRFAYWIESSTAHFAPVIPVSDPLLTSSVRVR